MSASDICFVEWKEQYVSKEKGNRVVHYFLKDSSGESILAVVGTERSVRHMFYVVAEEFLKAYGSENSVHAGFRWRSRREVVNWLTSMLSKQHRHNEYSSSPKDDPSFGSDYQQNQTRESKDRVAMNSRGNSSNIKWSGVPWSCGKQLKHFPAFGRNGITITMHSFVYVMAEKENQYLAYIEDMYEDRKGQKKVKVRWFHHIREVSGVVSLTDPHPKEVFITPYAQVISAECVDGPAIVLTRDHYEKCAVILPKDLLARAYFCIRQFKSSRVKPFKLGKLRGYFDQPIFSCFSPDFFDDEESSSGDEAKIKKTRSSKDRTAATNKLSIDNLRNGLRGMGLNSNKHGDSQSSQTPTYSVNEKIEFLCQDSGIRGCWFRCTILEVSPRQIKVQYDDVMDVESGDKLEECIPAFRLAKPDKLGMRYTGRPTIRPAVVTVDHTDAVFKVGDPVDTWWCDGWWEGVVTGFNSGNESYQVHLPGENRFLSAEKKMLRVSRDWVGGRWEDVEGNPNILSVVSAAGNIDSKPSSSSAITKEAKSDGSPMSCLPTDVKPRVACETEGKDWVPGDQQQLLEDKNAESESKLGDEDSPLAEIDKSRDSNKDKVDIDAEIDEDINLAKFGAIAQSDAMEIEAAAP